MIKLMETGIVVPVYNENLRVVETIKSILKITKNRLIVVDDGSRDDSLKFLKKNFSKNKRVVILPRVVNLGKRGWEIDNEEETDFVGYSEQKLGIIWGTIPGSLFDNMGY